MPREPPRLQGCFWMATIPHHMFVPYLPPGVCHLQGQLERGHGGLAGGAAPDGGGLPLQDDGPAGYLHWQICITFATKKTLLQARGIFGNAHLELTRSAAAREYVWKEDTRVEGLIK